MRIGKVIGRVTLSVRCERYVGERLLLTLPFTNESFRENCEKNSYSVVVYDSLGAAPDDLICFSEGGEASQAFPEPTPCDAFNAAIVDDYFYRETDKLTSDD